MYYLIISSSVIRKTKYWYKNGKCHRIKGPAIYTNGGVWFWYRPPASIIWDSSTNSMSSKVSIPKHYTDVIQAWMKNGEFHRDCDLPAVEFNDKNKEFWENGRLYQILEYPNGTKEWVSNSVLNKKDGPAVVYPNGDLEYWVNGKRHRLDGPAVIIGDKQYWFENGEFLKRD